MTKLIDLVGRCDTGLARGLSLQIIDELNLLVPNALVSITDLFVDVQGNQINPFVQPKAKAALALAIQERGTRLIINSAYRTVAQQCLIQAQYQAGLCGITAAARPGTSNHEGGLALDVEDPDGWEPFFARHGWKRLGRDFDPPHFDFNLLAGTRQDLKQLGVKAFQSLWNKHHPADPITADGLYGPATAARLSQSPAEGFGVPVVVVLRRGDRGREVKVLQQALGLSGDAADGVFGTATEQALIGFQRSKGLSSDGVAGPGTLAALGLRFNTSEPTTVSISAAAPTSLQALIQTSAVIPLDSLAANSALTTEIQSRLQAVGLLEANGVDGVHGPRTQAAIERFAAAAFLDNAATGKLGPTLARKLLEARTLQQPNQTAVAESSPAEGLPVAFAKALEFTLPAEGGRVDHPADPGGRTNKGIIQSVYNSYRRAKNLPVSDVFDISDREVKEIYLNNYWTPAQCQRMVLPLAVVHFDTAVNFGVGGAVQFLQEALGLPADGSFGPQTLAAFQASNSKALALKIVAGRMAYRQLRVVQAPSQRVFLQGWLNRDNALHAFIQPLNA